MPKYKVTREATYIEVAYVEADDPREVYRLEEEDDLNFELEVNISGFDPFPFLTDKVR
jgi:hypothetical protein